MDRSSITWTLSLQANCYYLFQDINPILTTSGLNYIANLTTNSYNETLGTVGTYYYAVVAANQFGNSSISNNVNVYVSDPVVSLSLTLPDPSVSGLISLSWTSSVGTTCVYLYRDVNPICNGTTLNYLLNTTADSYTDIITNIGIYYYAVVAESPLGNRSVSNCVNVTVDGNDWPTFKGDLTHDGVGINGIGSNYAVAWKNQILPTPVSSPVIAGGMVYTGSSGRIYCLNATTGSIIWSNTTTGTALSSPTVAGEFVYIGSDNYNFYCFNAISGNLVWTYTTNNFIETSPVVFGGNVYIGSGDGNLYCLNAFTGIQVWNYSTGNEFLSSPAISTGYIYIGNI